MTFPHPWGRALFNSAAHRIITLMVTIPPVIILIALIAQGHGSSTWLAPIAALPWAPLVLGPLWAKKAE